MQNEYIFINKLFSTASSLHTHMNCKKYEIYIVHFKLNNNCLYKCKVNKVQMQRSV